MFESTIFQNFLNRAKKISFIGVGSLIFINSATAAEIINGGFESGTFDNWDPFGDASIQPGGEDALKNFTQVDPFSGAFHALITTACPSTAEIQCSGIRNDDERTPIATFNFSGNDQGNADNANTGPGPIVNLQDFLGLPIDSLNIPRENALLPGLRLPREGSGIKRTVSADKEFILSFKWDFLTNDGTDQILGDQDFAFVTIYDVNSATNTRTITILEDSTGPILPPAPTDTEFLKETDSYQMFMSDLLPAGEYIVGFGVVDADELARSSALVIDEVTAEHFTVTSVPEPATPGIALLSTLGLGSLLRGKEQR